MPPERHQHPPARERTFAELFPWRNIRRATFLLLLILGIVMIKRSAASLLGRVGAMWGPTASAPTRAPGGNAVHRIRVDPGAVPQIPATEIRAE